MQGTVLVDVRSRRAAARTDPQRLLIGDVDSVGRELFAEIPATHPVHICFSFKVGTPAQAAMRSMELLFGESSRGSSAPLARSTAPRRSDQPTPFCLNQRASWPAVLGRLRGSLA